VQEGEEVTRYTFVVQIHPDGLSTLENLSTHERVRVTDLAAVGPQIEDGCRPTPVPSAQPTEEKSMLTSCVCCASSRSPSPSRAFSRPRHQRPVLVWSNLGAQGRRPHVAALDGPRRRAQHGHAGQADRGRGVPRRRQPAGNTVSMTTSPIWDGSI